MVVTNFQWRKKNVKNQRQNKSHYHFHHAVNYFDGFLYQKWFTNQHWSGFSCH